MKHIKRSFPYLSKVLAHSQEQVSNKYQFQLPKPSHTSSESGNQNSTTPTPKMAASKVPTRFMIISDTHNFEFGNAERYGGPFTHPPPKVDVLLHCGDLTGRGGLPAYEKLLNMLSKIDAELKLVIAGNHDLDLDKEHWRRKYEHPEDPESLTQHEDALEIMRGPLAQAAGVTYLEEGINTFTLSNGAKFTIYTSPYQPEFCDWAFPYWRDQDRFNPPHQVAPNVKSIVQTPVPDFPGIDILMTHGPPKGILDWTVYDNLAVGCDALMRAVSRARPLLYCFGHIHEAYGAEVVKWTDDKGKIGPEAIEEKTAKENQYPKENKFELEFGKETLMVNAAIMNVSYRPTNAPW